MEAFLSLVRVRHPLRGDFSICNKAHCDRAPCHSAPAGQLDVEAELDDVAGLHYEADPPVIVDPDAVLASPVPFSASRHVEP